MRSVQIRTNKHKPSVCTSALHRSSFPLSLSASKHFCLFLRKDSVISFVGKVAFFMTSPLPHLFPAQVHSQIIYFVFHWSLIRDFHCEHQKASWWSCILGRAPQGKCKQAPVKLSTVSSITHTHTHCSFIYQQINFNKQPYSKITIWMCY